MAEIYVSSGVTSTGVIVSSYDSMYVLSAGTANSTTVNGGDYYYGYMFISSGGVANSTTVNFGGMDVSSGGVANSTTVNSGWMTISSGGVANSTTVNEGAMIIESKGVANSTTVNTGVINIYDGVANSTTINSGGETYLYGGTANHTVVNSGGVLYMGYYTYWGGEHAGGCYLNDTVINSGGLAMIKDGYVSKITVNSGGRLDFCLGSGSNFSPGTEAIGGDDVFIKAGGVMTVAGVSGCVTIIKNVTISSGGLAVVSEGGLLSWTKISEGGNITVQDFGEVCDTQVRGGLRIQDNAEANSTSILGSGIVKLTGEAYDTSVSDRGALFVGFGGVATNITVNGGGVYVATGGEIKGKISVSQSGKLYLYGGSIVDGEIHVKGLLSVDEDMVNNGHITVSLNAATPAMAMIENLDYLSGTGNFTVDTGAVGLGSYSLASGAENYDGTVTVCDDSSTLCTLGVNESMTVADITYSLSKNNDVLSLTMETAAAKPAKSDVDGNNISDIVFQYTGGNYQIGFWMNGTNSWQGQGIGQPQDWELIGAYDMDQDGKADIVMRGNIQIGSDKGAYIGYYVDGDVNNWQNISYLNNPNDIDWRLAIGNITGNENCNSLVWYSPELGALGVWTDGTDNWVSLGSGYDYSWTLEGCGDFDGDGKDDILFSHEGNLYCTDIDNNFRSLGGWGTDWKVCTIGDFSGDGKDDIILQNGNMVVKFEDGLAENWESVGVMDATDWFIVGAGDYNGDQEEDLLVRQYSTGMLGYYESGDMNKWVEVGRGVDMNWTVIA